jgi:hypothetical protein
MTVIRFSTAEKLAEIEREIAMRRRTYPGLIARGTLTMRQASTQMDILREVAADYRSRMGDHTGGPSFGPTTESKNMNSS